MILFFSILSLSLSQMNERRRSVHDYYSTASLRGKIHLRHQAEFPLRAKLQPEIERGQKEKA
jgi:hypothetical protein